MTLLKATVLVGAFAIIASFATAQNAPNGYDAAKDFAANPYVSVGTNLLNPYEEVDRNWFRLPKGMKWVGADVLAVDSRGNVWAMTRCRQQTCSKLVPHEPAIFEFDPSGKYIKSFGQDLFVEPHGFFVDKHDNLWVADVKGNQVVELSPDGKVLLTLGTRGVMGGSPENLDGPANMYVSPNGDIFVADGHTVLPWGGGEWFGFNAARTNEQSHAGIVEFSPTGKFIRRWGQLGTGPGEFNVPHSIAMDSQGRVFVADTGNNRIQIFDQDGKFIDQWKQFGKPNGIFIDKNDVLYATDSQSVEDLWEEDYSAIGNTSGMALLRQPRLTDIGRESQMKQGIRIGSARTGVVKYYIPAPDINGPFGPVGLPEFLWVDNKGAIYAGEERDHTYRKYVKKVELPEGTGQESVQRACTLCHGLGEFPRVNFDRQDWELVVKTMIAGGAPLTQDEIPTVVGYLATNFRGVDTPGVVVPGNLQVTIKEWNVPTPSSLPSDILHSPITGLVWYTGQFSNVMGRFDPKTQQFKEYHLRPGTNPTSLAEWPMANVRGLLYFTPQMGTFLGEFHPRNGPYPRWKEGDLKEDPTARSKLLFDDIATNGVNWLGWFTVTNALAPLYPEGSMIGNFNPLTTEVRFAHTLTPNADPHALAINSNGVPFFTERNGPKLGSVDPNTMHVAEYILPNMQSRPYGVTVTPDDMVWYTDYTRGYLGRFDPDTGQFSEWASPSGPQSRPYGITHVGNIIWYAETGTKPNMLVRFDPKTEKFQSWEVKAGGGIRHIYGDADGSLWFTRPLANGIAQAIIKEE